MSNTTRWILGLVALLITGGLAPAYGVTLVNDGTARAVIVIADASSPAAKRAAVVLQAHIRQISGATLTIQAEHDLKTGATKQQPLILVGEGKLAKDLGFSTAGQGPGGFYIEAKENVLALIHQPAQIAERGVVE